MQRCGPESAASLQGWLGLAAVFALVALGATAHAAESDIVIEKGSDYAQAESEGWVSGFETDADAGTFKVTLHGLPGARITIDDLVLVNASQDQTLQVSVTDTVPDASEVRVRFWTGDEAPTSDTDDNVCIVANLSTSEDPDEQCQASQVHLQYVITLTEKVGSTPFSFDIERVTGTSNSSGGGGASLAESVETEAETEPAPEMADERWTTDEEGIAEDGTYTVTFPESAGSLEEIEVATQEDCSGFRLVVDRYQTAPGDAGPGLRGLDASEVRAECQGEPASDVVERALVGFHVRPGALGPAERPRQVHALFQEGSAWTPVGQGLAGVDGTDVQADLPALGLVGLHVDQAAPEIQLDSAPANGDREGVAGIVASVQDNVQVETLEVYLDGELVERRTQAPFRAIVTGESQGTPQDVKILARDVSGLTHTIHRTVILVPDHTEPHLRLGTPYVDDEGRLELPTESHDNVAVERVEMYVDGELVHTDRTPPFAMETDTSDLAPGFHRVTVAAFDASRNQGQAEGVFHAPVDVTADRASSEPAPLELPPELDRVAVGVGVTLAGLGAGIMASGWMLRGRPSS